MKSEMRPHQVNALNALKASIKAGNTRPMVQAPTGAGKTILAAAIVDGARRKGNRVTFVVPAISLIDQTVQRFWAEGIRDVGVIQADHPMTNPSMPVQVASVQTLQNRNLNHIPDANVIVIDEAHKWFKFYEAWMTAWSARLFIGLSATPWTKGLGKWYDELIVAATTQDLIDTGYLSDFRVFAPSHPDLSKVRTVAGDFHEGDLAEVMGESRIMSDVVRTWLERGRGRNTLCFAVDRAHARKLQEDFKAHGVRAEYIDAFTPLHERDQIAKALHAGQVEVVCNVGCLTTGIDWDVRCIILARPTKSEMLFVQMIGRGLRIAEGKQDCLILDHSDTHLRLGFVTDIHHDTLDTGAHKQSKTQEREKPLPKDCPSCGFVKAPGVSLCPHCGFKPQRQSQVEAKEGELAELDKARKRNRQFTPAEKAQFYGELLHYAMTTGKKRGWADHKYREKFSVWPNAHKDAAPVETSPETLSWIKSRNIAWSKRRAA